MKHTFIFELYDAGATEQNLSRLVYVVESLPISLKYEVQGGNLLAVKLFTDVSTAAGVITRAGWQPGKIIEALKMARQRGDAAVRQAQERLGILRHNKTARPPEIPVALEVRVKQLRAAGCEINITPMLPGGFEAVVFNESFIFDDERETFEFLRGLEKGFTSAPLWASVKQVVLHGSIAKATRRSKRSA